MIDKNCLKNLEYDYKYSEMIGKYELELDDKINKNNVFKGVEYI